MQVLRVVNLTKIFTSGFWPFQKQYKYIAVNDISFQLKKGEILGLLGPNGAGKTTTIQMLLGTLTPSKGSIEYFGKNFAYNKIDSLKKIGYGSAYDRLPARLTVVENLDIVGRIYGIEQPQLLQQIEKLLKFFEIWEMRDKPTGTLSAGQITRVILAKAFLADPEIVLLDEPTASLDPDVANEVRHFILRQCKERNISILITSHNMNEVTELCDRVLVLKNGSIIADNTPEFLAKSISKVHIKLNIVNGIDTIKKYLDEIKLKYNEKDQYLIIEIDEQNVAQFIADLGERKIIYSQISIDKPTLEDYFLNIVKSK